MTDLAPVLTGCHVCRSPIVEGINAKLVGRVSLRKVSDFTRDAGHYISVNTLLKHKNNHLTTDFERERIKATDALRVQQNKIKAKPGDLATLVRDNVYARVEEGLLEPGLADGLRAQQMLDARAEKGADRGLLLTLAQVLGGGNVLPALTDGNTVEGEYTEIDDEAAADEAMFARLTAG